MLVPGLEISLKRRPLSLAWRQRECYPDRVTWTLLSPCRRHPNLTVAKFAFDRILESNYKDQAASYVVLGYVYSASGRNDFAEELRSQRLQRGAVDVTVAERMHAFHVSEIPSELAS